MIIETSKGVVVRASKPRNPWEAYTALDTRTYSGQSMSPEESLALPAVMGGVKLISEHNGTMPLETIDTRSNLGREVVRDGWLAPMLLHAPNEDQSGADLWTMVNAHLLLRGNAYLAKLRDTQGIIRELYPLHPSCVNPYRNRDGVKQFRVRVYDGIDYIDMDLTPSDVLHIKGPSIIDPLVGESVVAHCRHALGTHAAQIEYQARTYQDGMLIKGALSTPGNLSPDAAERIKAQWRSAYSGIGNSHDIAVLHSGAKFEQVSMSPEDAQFIQSMRWGHTQVATMLKLPASRLNGEGSSLTYANMGQDDLFMDKQACMPLRVLIESALNRDTDLFGPISPWIPRFNEAAQLRADIKTRFEVYEIERRLGTLSQNEIRELEDRPGIGPDGDDHAPLRAATPTPAPDPAAANAERALRLQELEAERKHELRVAELSAPRTIVPVPGVQVDVDVPPQPAPVVNVAAPDVRVEQQPAPVVNVSVPEQPAPEVRVDVASPNVQVDVAAPTVQVAAPNVTVEPRIEIPASSGKRMSIKRNERGQITGAVVEGE